MISEFLKLKPVVDESALTGMVVKLNKRFGDVAKKFKSGLSSAFKFGPAAIGGAIGGALLGGLISRVLNPLKEAEEIIDRILDKGSDITTFASELQSNPGKLAKLESFAQAKGLGSDDLRKMLLDFQSELANERTRVKDSSEKPGLLRNFVNQEDTVQAFFDFVKSLQHVSKDVQVIAEETIFGGKIRGRATNFLNAKDFNQVFTQLPSAKSLGNAAVHTGKLADERDLQTAIRDAFDFINKSPLINNQMLNDIDSGKKLDQAKENETLKRFEELKKIANSMQELIGKFDTFVSNLITVGVPALISGFNGIKDSIGTGFNAIQNIWNQFKSIKLPRDSNRNRL